jgi:hypothetical protein
MDRISNTSLTDIWEELQIAGLASAEHASEAYNSSAWLVSSSFETTARAVAWTIDERGGLAKIAGMAMVPSQFLGPTRVTADAIIENTVASLPCNGIARIERGQIFSDTGDAIEIAILYPRALEYTLEEKCVVYNNPNGCTVPQFLDRGLSPYSTPYHVLKKNKCPMIMYDYRGTGLSQESDVESSSMRTTRPSAHTIASDGYTVLNYAMQSSRSVEVWGSSLGGGVATVACESYLQKNPNHVGRLSLYNHDSFTTTGKVVLPSCLNFLATIVGANLDAETAMRSLATRGLKIVVLCHRDDPVIGIGARMAEILPELQGNITLIDSPLFGHANLSDDMLYRLE